MSEVPTIFIPCHPVQTKRTTELLRAKAKSHAARRSRHQPWYQPNLALIPQKPAYNTRPSDQHGQTQQPRQQSSGAARSQNTIIGLFRGNSDPFCAFAVTVTPEVNRLISFLRDNVLPATFLGNLFRGAVSPTSSSLPRPSSGSSYNEPGTLRAWRMEQTNLQDECIAYARLALYASMMNTVAPDHRSTTLTALHMRARSAGVLLSRLKDGRKTMPDDLVTASILPHLVYLFAADCQGDNIDAAAIHARLLTYAFEQGHWTMHWLMMTLLHDIDFANRHGQRLFIDVDHWCPKALGPTMARMQQALPPFRDRAGFENPDPGITYPPYKAIWHRRVSKEAYPGQVLESPLLGNMAYTYSAMTGFIELGQLHNMALDLMEGRVFTTDEAGRRIDHEERCSQAALAIVLAYFGRRLGHECVINGVDVWDAERAWRRRLRTAVEGAWPAHAEQDLRKNVRLWVLYVGAMDEQVVRYWKNGMQVHSCDSLNDACLHDTEGTWFLRQLRSLALLMKVTSWEKMQAVRAKFSTIKGLVADGSWWYDNLLDS
jgi:hypothetical protein